MQEREDSEDYDDELQELIAGARRQLRFKLQSARLMRSGRERSKEDDALEARLRQEMQDKLDASIRKLEDERSRKAVAVESTDNEPFLADQYHFGVVSTWLDELREDAESIGASRQLRSDWEAVKDWLGIRNAITATQYQQFYLGFARYAKTHEAPSKGLRQSFDHFSSALPDSSVQPPVAIYGVFARLLATDEEIEEEEARKELKPIFAELAKTRSPQRSVLAGPGFVTALVGLTCFWMAMRGAQIVMVTIPFVAFSLYLILLGPKSEEIQGSPSKAIIATFAAVLSAGVCAIGFLIGMVFA